MKDTFQILMYIYRIQKDSTEDPICWSAKEAGSEIKNGLLDTVREGKDGMLWDNSTETYTLLYIK